MSEPDHIPVLPNETMELLSPQPGEVAVDCTVGLGGHAALLARAVGETGRLIAFDLDAGNLERATTRVAAQGVPFDACRESFVRAAMRLREMGLAADVALADLGVSSSQLDDPSRGFSFREDGPLDMRFEREAAEGAIPRARSAADLLATLDEAEIADIITIFGEEPLAAKIARKLVQSRRAEPIETTAQLVALVLEAYGARARTSRMHPATRTFMALRIAVNGELDALSAFLDSITRAAGTAGSGGWLAAQARIAVISFHSLEDRLVKRAFADLARRGLATVLTKRPVTATAAEASQNPRSRSAKLRVIRLGDGGEGKWPSGSTAGGG